MRSVIVIVLVIAVVSSAMGVAVLRHEARQTFAELQVANEARDDALTEWSRLQLELASLAELGRVERAAMDQLKMTTPRHTEVILENMPTPIDEVIN